MLARSASPSLSDGLTARSSLGRTTGASRLAASTGAEGAAAARPEVAGAADARAAAFATANTGGSATAAVVVGRASAGLLDRPRTNTATGLKMPNRRRPIGTPASVGELQ